MRGRDFELRLTLSADTLRIKVSDARTERRPREVLPDGESGRGLLLVAAVADRWSVHDRVPIGKTVRAEIAVRCQSSTLTFGQD